ncbi:MAG: hypothetical protein JMDDDDMK_03538 [Acidobacteria bacterium]|nr:hypothetical protein [Acidobacteriota bacterium]
MQSDKCVSSPGQRPAWFLKTALALIGLLLMVNSASAQVK